MFRSSIRVYAQSPSFSKSFYIEWVDNFCCPMSYMLTAIPFLTNLSTMFKEPTAGLSSHFERWPRQPNHCLKYQAALKNGPSYQWAVYLHLHNYLSSASFQHVCGYNKKVLNNALSWDSWRTISHSHVLPQNKWWRHLNYRKDRVIHQAPIKAFY